MGYQNSRNRIFNEKELINYAQNSTQIIFIGILGKGHQNKSFPKSKDNVQIQISVIAKILITPTIL